MRGRAEMVSFLQKFSAAKEMAEETLGVLCRTHKDLAINAASATERNNF
jgi:hypothetical protein